MTICHCCPFYLGHLVNMCLCVCFVFRHTNKCLYWHFNIFVVYICVRHGFEFMETVKNPEVALAARPV